MRLAGQRAERDEARPMHAEVAQASPPLEWLRVRARQENFPVALHVLPPRYRRHLLTLYAFARMVDDIGDAAPGDRLLQLDRISAELDRMYAGRTGDDPLFQRLAYTVSECELPQSELERLVEANRRDQVVHRYRTFDELLDYCALSANPVGRLVLRVFGVSTERRAHLSDRICSALQVLEHCQDVAEDACAGRIYLPRHDLDRFGVVEEDLMAAQASTGVRAVVALQVQRAVRLLDEGGPLVDDLRGAARLAVAGYVAGGRATARALVDAGFDVLARTPRPRKSHMLCSLLASLGIGDAR
ncbi:squalene synthase HpnC [Saccharomonospora viridis]|jgi:squalene synthase HpnC|uniref:Squalene synthase HpnC n=2 Tax=Saccharomonospora viridis TaxID=1852 RepID=C7MXP1_SACVD|nr:squalene synthase HpnC [Saccharomonospora viridis]ACU97320.1 squalene synthase HpnC [Saccharomonospora viridis DSM 43017]KHF43592.1 squalene synthase [Saccharomonospora viridis]SFO76620.1 squalene synthase HpnC [Saccharomonospora viridis]